MNLEEIRSHYPGLHNGIQLNTGGVGLPSIEVREAIDAGFNKLYEEHVPPIEWHSQMCESADVARGKMAAFLGAERDEMALTVSTADGYAAAIGGLTWQPGDEVVITSEEHPMPHQAVLGLQEREGVVLKVVEIDHDPAVMLERTERALTSRTKMICMSHVTTDSGLVVPAEGICKLARERGIVTLWDGCHAIAQVPVHLNDMGCDFYAANCYKWILGPMGTGFLYVSKEAQQLLKPLVHPHNAEGDAAQYRTSNPAHALYAGVGATIDYIESIGGVEAIQQECVRKTDILKANLDAVPGAIVVSSRRPDSQTGTVTFAIEGMDGKDVDHALRNRWQIVQRGTYMTEPTGVRISVAFYTSDEELDTLVDAVKVLAKEAGN
jgi:selenocysteine lyase/cysteine desulfurase